MSSSVPLSRVVKCSIHHGLPRADLAFSVPPWQQPQVLDFDVSNVLKFRILLSLRSHLQGKRAERASSALGRGSVKIYGGPRTGVQRLNLRDGVLGEIEKNSFTALPGKGGHSRRIPSKLCVLTWRG